MSKVAVGVQDWDFGTVIPPRIALALRSGGRLTAQVSGTCDGDSSSFEGWSCVGCPQSYFQDLAASLGQIRAHLSAEASGKQCQPQWLNPAS